jgi:AraC-like DNA-binding protein
VRNVYSGGLGPAEPATLSLDTIWDVDADPAYDVRRSGAGGSRLVAIRTLAGRGALTLIGGGEPLALDPGTLVLTHQRRIARYRCAGRRWRFWWFEFTGAPRAACPFDVPFATPTRAGDAEVFRRTFASLRRPPPAERSAATAGFSLLLHGWIAGQAAPAQTRLHEREVRGVIDAMYERLETGWRVEEMARAARLSERRFRQVFALNTGDSPKKYFDRLRMEKGRQLLQLGLYTVQEVADQFGFSSPFHFSKAYRRLYGVPPSRERAHAASAGG